MVNSDEITRKDVLKILGISKPTLKRWIARGLFNITVRQVGSVPFRFFSRREVLKIKTQMLKHRPKGQSYIPLKNPAN